MLSMKMDDLSWIDNCDRCNNERHVLNPDTWRYERCPKCFEALGLRRFLNPGLRRKEGLFPPATYPVLPVDEIVCMGGTPDSREPFRYQVWGSLVHYYCTMREKFPLTGPPYECQDVRWLVDMQFDNVEEYKCTRHLLKVEFLALRLSESPNHKLVPQLVCELLSQRYDAMKSLWLWSPVPLGALRNVYGSEFVSFVRDVKPIADGRVATAAPRPSAFRKRCV